MKNFISGLQSKYPKLTQGVKGIGNHLLQIGFISLLLIVILYHKPLGVAVSKTFHSFEAPLPLDTVQLNSFYLQSNPEDLSVAINERDELLILNRKDGTFVVYDDTTSTLIFQAYAKQMQYEKNTVSTISK